jgi:hypothetical protein
MGQGGGAGCANYLNAYFSIAVFKGGAFKAGDMMSELGKFLDECFRLLQQREFIRKYQFSRLEFLP